MQIIDTHTHLYHEAFDNDQKKVIDRAMAVGINHFFIPSIDSSYVDRMYTLEKSFPDQIHLMAGLHPCYVKENYAEELDKVAAQLKSRTFFAIGEIGIDLYWDNTFLNYQKEAFSIQIQWAKQYRLPIVIHCREAFDEIFEILEQHKSSTLSGIFHCFTGSLKQAERAINLNFKLGIGGVVTFKNGKIDQFLHKLPLESIVLETDAPYLSPTPHRGKRNESSYITLILDKIASCYQCSRDELASLTTKNAMEVFKIDNFKIKK
ncbi:MAG: hydrolase TatD [Flavobacteriaceae bacterium]|nr:hydrolase TatD [Flavobacteriaceae bacterium]